MAIYKIGSHPRRHWPEYSFPRFSWPKAPSGFTPSDDLQHTPSFVVRSYLVNESLVSLPNVGTWPLYISHLPDGQDIQDNAGGIYDTTPLIDERVYDGSSNKHYGLQIKIRSIDYEIGKAKIESILSSMEDIHNNEVSFGIYTYEIRTANPSTGIIPLGTEQGTKRRYLFTVNFLIILKYLELAA